MDSQCKFGVVARGQASLYLRCSDRDQQIWDIAAGAMIVEEAGGKATEGRDGYLWTPYESTPVDSYGYGGWGREGRRGEPK